MMTIDSLLLRVPLAGSITNYRSTPIGQIAKIACAVSKVALLTLALLATVQLISGPALYLAVIGLSITALTCQLMGTKGAWNESITALIDVALLCCAVAILGGLPLMSAPLFGVSILTAQIGKLILTDLLQKPPMYQVTPNNQEKNSILTKKEIKPYLPNPLFQISDKVTGLCRDGLFVSGRLLASITHRKNYSKKIPTQNSQGLIVLIHGLCNDPSIFDGYYDKLKKQHGSSITLAQLYVNKRGNCSLEEAAKPIYQDILAWTKKNPKKPIALVGFSNGNRIIASTLHHLQKHGAKNPIHYSGIAGPMKGTKVMQRPKFSNLNLLDLPKQLGYQLIVKNKILTKEIDEEMNWDSECSKKVIANLQKTASKSDLQAEFYGTTSDAAVCPGRSAFPRVKNGTYSLTNRDGHHSLVNTSKKSIVRRISLFFEKRIQTNA